MRIFIAHGRELRHTSTLSSPFAEATPSSKENIQSSEVATVNCTAGVLGFFAEWRTLPSAALPLTSRTPLVAAAA